MLGLLALLWCCRIFCRYLFNHLVFVIWVDAPDCEFAALVIESHQIRGIARLVGQAAKGLNFGEVNDAIIILLNADVPTLQLDIAL